MRYRIFVWDWKEQPPWDAINDDIHRVCDAAIWCVPRVTPIPNTESDQYAATVTPGFAPDGFAQQLWDNRYYDEGKDEGWFADA